MVAHDPRLAALAHSAPAPTCSTDPPDPRYGATCYGLSIVGLSERHGRMGVCAGLDNEASKASRRSRFHVGVEERTTSAYPYCLSGPRNVTNGRKALRRALR